MTSASAKDLAERLNTHRAAALKACDAGNDLLAPLIVDLHAAAALLTRYAEVEGELETKKEDLVNLEETRDLARAEAIANEATARAERLAGALRDRDDKWAAIERFRRALAADIKKDPAAMIPKADVEDFLTAITTNMQSTIAEVHAAEARLSDAALTEPEAKGGDSRPCAGDHGEDR